MSDRDPAKRIPHTLGTQPKLFGSYTLTDLAVALFPGVLVVLLTQVIVPSSVFIGDTPLQSVTLPIAGIAILIGGVLVSLTPAYTTSLDWILAFLGFRRSTHQLGHDEAKPHTQIERIHPQAGALERTDGAVLGMVQVTPPTMALATDREWAEKAGAFQDFCDTVLTFPIQIYSTVQPFPVEEYLAQYESRRTDPDVEANPQLAALMDEYTAWYATDLDARQMTIREHYVIVTVSPTEVQFERESVLSALASIPVLGVFIRAWLAPGRDDERAAMITELDERLRLVETGLREIDDCDAHRVPVGDATQVIAGFWAGQPQGYDDLAQVLRTRPIVGDT